MNPQAEANQIYAPALQAIQQQTPQIQQLYQTLVQGLQQQVAAQQQNVLQSAQQRGVAAPTLAGQVAGAYGQDMNLISAQLNAQRATDTAGINQELGKAGVSKANSVNELAQSLLKQNMENQQNAYEMSDIERKAALEQQQNQQSFEIQKTRADVQEAKRRQAAAAAAAGRAAVLSDKSFRNQVKSALLQVRGADGKVSPQDYRDMMGLWASKGLDVADFHNSFSGLVNYSHARDYFNTNSPGVVQNNLVSSNIKDLRF